MKNTNEKRYTGQLSVGAALIVILLPIAVFVAGLCVGRMTLPLSEVFRAVGGRLGLISDVSAQTDRVVFAMRLPRLLLGAVVGAGLSVAGCTFQHIFSNPLATPDTLGVASGASFGAALGLLFGFGQLGVQMTALFFGLAAILLTGLAGIGVRNANTPILAGIMVGSLFNSLVSLIKFTADTESALPSITYFLMGSMEGAGTRSMLIGLPPIILCTVILFLLRWRMNLLTLSEDEAISAGVHIRRLRVVCELCGAVMTASAVSLCGQVGWVGLLIPHICRMRFGANSAAIIPASIGVGAAFMMAVDTLSRTVSPKEIPVSVLTALLGAPFFIFLLRQNRGWSL